MLSRALEGQWLKSWLASSGLRRTELVPRLYGEASTTTCMGTPPRITETTPWWPCLTPPETSVSRLLAVRPCFGSWRQVRPARISWFRDDEIPTPLPLLSHSSGTLSPRRAPAGWPHDPPSRSWPAFLEYFSVFWLVSPGNQRGPPLRSSRTVRPECRRDLPSRNRCGRPRKRTDGRLVQEMPRKIWPNASSRGGR
jgi:hypothetical protein